MRPAPLSSTKRSGRDAPMDTGRKTRPPRLSKGRTATPSSLANTRGPGSGSVPDVRARPPAPKAIAATTAVLLQRAFIEYAQPLHHGRVLPYPDPRPYASKSKRDRGAMP